MSQNKIRVMLVDDHTVLRQGLKSLLCLEDDIAIVGEASNGEEAVAYSKIYNPDVILMDINMPRLSGVEATKQIKTILPKSKIIVLTSHNDDKSIFSLIKIGIDGYILKDVAADNLVSSIRDVYAGKSILHPEIAHKVLTKFTNKDQAKNNINLTEREIDILKALAKGYNNQKIAEELFISQRTVQNHLHNIYSKLGITGRTEALLYTIEHNIISKDSDNDL